MSHFAVLVLSNPDQSIDDLLLPYMENCCGQPPMQYMEFYEDECCDVDEATGKRGYWQNPNAKWDWFVIGGRFCGMLKANHGYRANGYFEETGKYPSNRYDQAVLRDCDFSKDEQAYNHALCEWEACIDGDCEDADRMMQFWPLSKEGIKKRYKTKENYAEQVATWNTWAVVTPDGEWYQCGTMGWWGISSESDAEQLDWVKNFKSRFIDSADQDLVATIVDCHI